MPLLDHFRPPLSDRRHWHSFHNSWATYLSSQLNSLLPEGWFAEANVQYSIEIDVAVIEDRDARAAESNWHPPPADASVPFESSGPVVEIGIFSRSGGPVLAGAIELVSPANKDRPASREAFVSKCAAYLQAGVGLIVVDVVTERGADLHSELLARLGSSNPTTHDRLFASAYRPVEVEGARKLDLWHSALVLGRTLPTLPLWLRGGYCFPVELEATYERTCSEQRIRPVVESAA